MSKYIVDTVNKNDYTAGSKARDDIKSILNSCGFEDITINIGDNKKNVFHEVSGIKKQLREKLSAVNDHSYVVFQYPWPTMSFEFAKIIRSICKEKKITSIAVIHDLNSVRTGSKVTKLYYDRYVQEIRYLDSFDYIVCHNSKMKGYLVSRGIADTKVICLNLFDYLVESEPSVGSSDYREVSIAGNLSPQKTKYIYDLVDAGFSSFKLNLYGPFYEGKTSDLIQYHGQFPASSLPSQITNGFGLVWDGDSTDTCTGHFGEYLKINNPHKLSLYMACGIPAIVWSQAAVADFVRENHVGICIDCLSDIDSILGSMNESSYLAMKHNAEEISKQVRSGYYIKNALTAINKDLVV
jgi:hypothetical protein